MNRIVESPLYLPAILIVAALGEGLVELLAQLLGV
jgi:hypothetical protein